ncbi:hypothetical protein WA026_018815, partial [Henosepilachna vigintioctopunctata]
MTPTIVDLILNKNVNNSTQSISLPELNSDHNPVVFCLRELPSEKIQKTFFNYKQTDWDKYRSLIDTATNINNNINSIQELEIEVDILTKTLINARNKTTNKIKYELSPDKIPDDIVDLIKSRNKIRKNGKIVKTPQKQ